MNQDQGIQAIDRGNPGKNKSKQTNVTSPKQIFKYNFNPF